MTYRLIIKPWIDRSTSVLALLLLSPILLILTALIAFRMGRPVLFRQTRIGLGDHAFGFLKFRTMTTERDADGNLLPDHARLTAFGRFLRSTSLDELPQLWNVARGEMSLIGPRPLLPEYLPRYSDEQRRRHHVKPGITGWAQVNGRNTISWDEKFRCDVWYVDNLSPAVDLRILMMTVASVLKRRGISQTGHATALPFLGSETERGEAGSATKLNTQ